MQESLFQTLHQLVGFLQTPVIATLLGLTLWVIWEMGVSVGERTRGLGLIRKSGDVERAMRLGRKRIGAAALLMRLGPMCGLMGTLIPLGPGLAALGRGEFELLAESVITAFDTTVLGLCVGLAGFLLHVFRRGWYDRLLDEMEAAHGA